jgi:hypothetical protein
MAISHMPALREASDATLQEFGGRTQMTSKSTWAGWERELATDLGGKRVYASGSFGKHGENPDVELEDLFVEAKCRARIPFLDVLDLCRANAGGKISAVALKEKRQGGSAISRKAVLMNYEQWLEMVRAWRAAKRGQLV